MKKGICRICKIEKDLSFEHIPPKTAFNKTTRYYSISHTDYFKSDNYFKPNLKGRVYQGGLGYYSLCRECNSFLGKEYVKSYKKWVNIGMDLNLKYDFGYVQFEALNQNPIRILKQIISMFICINEDWYTDEYPELLEFVKNPKNNELPEKYKIYSYLNSEGQIRTSGWNFTNTSGIIGEITFPPFGYVLNIENDKVLQKLTDITVFKKFPDNEQQYFQIGLRRLPTHLPIILDYRSKEEIQKKINQDKASTTYKTDA